MEQDGHNWKTSNPSDRCTKCGRTVGNYEAFKRARGVDLESLKCKPKE